MAVDIDQLFREKKVWSRTIRMMLLTLLIVLAASYQDISQGNLDSLSKTLAGLIALEGGILLGVLSVRNAFTAKSKARSMPVTPVTAAELSIFK